MKVIQFLLVMSIPTTMVMQIPYDNLTHLVASVVTTYHEHQPINTQLLSSDEQQVIQHFCSLGEEYARIESFAAEQRRDLYHDLKQAPPENILQTWYHTPNRTCEEHAYIVRQWKLETEKQATYSMPVQTMINHLQEMGSSIIGEYALVHEDEWEVNHEEMDIITNAFYDIHELHHDMVNHTATESECEYMISELQKLYRKLDEGDHQLLEELLLHQQQLLSATEALFAEFKNFLQ